MGSFTISKLAMATVVVLLGMASLVGPSAGQTPPACAQDLVPCADYLKNTAQPAANCCTAIKQAVATQFPCLCNLFFTPGLLETFGGNATSGLRIATACGESMDTAKCKAAIGAPTPGSTPGTPGPPGNDGSGSGKVEWTGFSALLLLWASVMAY
ncbi:lipid transfer-like protein VAS [Pyrus ussuriensis x Pyrus communis]|uniref:Lipid transfer-like protein VAS n=1 Tax=Pyrus ussuriensis x Pyrus communis TaxID=2448454 RepID=A0A5N5HXD6_9ROSA|nr:lipid transfer-like protein VAS [Pyrus ussuriensis x Pyrus communis]